MSWITRARQTHSQGEGGPKGPPPSEASTRRSPGLAAFFGLLRADGRHRVLDLGGADSANLRLLGRFARQIRFAGLIPRSVKLDAWLQALRALPPYPSDPYDVVIAWDLLDWLPADARPDVIARLDQVTSDGAIVYALADGSVEAPAPPLTFALTDLEHVRETRGLDAAIERKRLLPAQMKGALAPFEIVHAFTLRSGFREYVARKPRPPDDGRGERVPLA